MTSLDLRPAQDSVLYQMLRLGLVFDHSDDNGGQAWFDYNIGLRCDFTGDKPDTVTFTDINTRLSQEVAASDLAGLSGVITWQSETPAEPAGE